jgi:hypothetical protein
MGDGFNRMMLKDRWDALKQVYSLHSSYSITLLSGAIMAFVLFYFTKYDLIAGNLGKVYANTQVISQIALSVLFGVNLSILWYKLKISSGVDAKAKGTTALGSVIAIIVSGCPACGVTLAGYLGLASFFSVFPLYGLELKFVGIGLLVYSTNYLLKNLNYCKTK